MGNGMQTVKYLAPGTASDWMLSELNIISVTPELGTKARVTDTFFIESKEDLLKVIEDNYKWINFSFAWVIKEFPVKTKEIKKTSVIHKMLQDLMGVLIPAKTGPEKPSIKEEVEEKG